MWREFTLAVIGGLFLYPVASKRIRDVQTGGAVEIDLAVLSTLC